MTKLAFRQDMKVTLEDHMGSDLKIARAARASTAKDDLDLPYEGRVRSLMRLHHNSPFEHNVVTVRVEVPKRVVWEWERHRTQSYSELSTRYAVMLPEFYLPPRERPILHVGKPMAYQRAFADGATHMAVNNRRRRHAKYAWKAYEEDREAGVALETAAEHLPPYIYSRFWATANLLNWFRFLDLRTDESALWEIRVAAEQVLDILMELYPVAVGAWNEYRLTGEIS